MPYMETLNEQQKEVVLTNEGALAVMSSAGAGKTRTAVAKMAYLITELGILPSRIIACTFTNKAADEMKERLKVLVGEKAEKVKLSTIHSLCYKIYRSGRRLKEAWFKMPKTLVNDYAPLMHLYRFCKTQNLGNRDAKGYLQLIANMKLDLITVKNYQQFRPYIDGDASFTEDVHIVYREYEAWKKKNGYIDFQDILVNCYSLLTDPKYAAFTKALQQKCEYILVDEAQDTNTVAFKIIDILASHHKRVTIVGDTRQLIYSFQGARMENITGFIKKYSPKLIDLNINYRSTKTIVENANKLISYATDTIGAPATTPNETGEEIKYYTSEDASHEADTILHLVEHLVSTGEQYRDITILYRLHSQSVAIEDTFIMADIPYVTFTDNSFYERKEIKDMTSYLDIFTDPAKMTKVDLKRIVNRPSRFIKNAAVDELADYAEDENMCLWNALREVHNTDLDYGSKKNLDSLFDSLYTGMKMANNNATVSELFNYVLDDLGYEEWAIAEKIEKTPDSDVTLSFDALLDVGKRFDKPKEFYEYRNLVKEEEKKRKEKRKDKDGDYIKMMSIHASKGKEFKNVIVIGLCDRLYPFHRAVEEGNENEERRVAYVAVTRPEKRLFLSVIDGMLGRFKVKPSRYMYQMNFKYNGDCNDHS